MGKSTIMKTSSNTGSEYCNNQILFFTYENLINRKSTCLLDSLICFYIKPYFQCDRVPVKHSRFH